jgi:RNase P/RNase MRP subunit p29
MSIKKVSNNILLFGKMIEVTSATEKLLVGMSGTVVDETKNSIIVLTKDGPRTIMKNKIFFKIIDKTNEDKTYDGKDFQKTVENRIQR